MKKFELYKLSFRLAKHRHNILPSLAIAAAVICLLTASINYMDVHNQKARPFELIAMGSDIQDKTILTISNLDTVLRATAVLPVSATMIAEQYSAKVILNGVSASYLNGNFEKGGVFPDNTIMPYIVLNNAALNKLLDKDGKVVPKDKKIDWLGQTIILQLDGQVTAKICGILENDSEIPEVYMSISSAKSFVPTSYTEIRLQLKNVGSKPAVSKKLSSLGLSTTNADADLLNEWEKTETSAHFFLGEGLVALICAFIVLRKNRQIEREQNRKQFEMLRFIGLSQKSIRLIFLYMDTFVMSAGIALGIFINLIIRVFHTS